jgi:hypothetical protein
VRSSPPSSFNSQRFSRKTLLLPISRYSDQIGLLTVDAAEASLSVTSIGFAVAPITKTNHFLFHENEI